MRGGTTRPQHPVMPIRRDPLARLIDSVAPVVTMEQEGLVVIALRTRWNEDGPAYLTFEQAHADKVVEIHEDGLGSVPSVEVETGRSPVVVFGGDTLVGGKQNRIVNVTVWLHAMATTKLPVTCVEQGRWDQGADAVFRSGPKADLRLRAALGRQVETNARWAHDAGDHGSRFVADQSSVWNEVGARHERAATTSATGALHDLYAREAQDVESLERAFPCPDGTTGAAIGIAGRLVALELYDRPTTLRRLWGRVIEGAVRAHLDHQRMAAAGMAPKAQHRYPDRDALGRMLRRAKRAQPDATRAPSVGEGTDVRFGTERITGAALLLDDHVVHAEVHRVSA